MKILIRVGLISIAIFIDLFIYVILGLILVSYEDFYDESKGVYYSLESMTPLQLSAYIGLQVWIIVNLLLIGFIIYRLIRHFIKRRKPIPHEKPIS